MRALPPRPAMRAALATVILAVAHAAAAQPAPLYRQIGPLHAAAADLTTAEAPVELEAATLALLHAPEPVWVSLPLPGHAAPLEAKLERFAIRGPDSFTLVGRVDEDLLGWVVVTVEQDVVFVNVQSAAHGAWQLRRSGAGAPVLRRIDSSLAAPCGLGMDEPALAPMAAVHPGALPADGGLVPRGVCGDDGSFIDVLVVYSALGIASAGGQTAMQALINMAADEANLAMANSNIPMAIRIVHRQEVVHTDASGTATDLTRLRETDDGRLDEVHALRDQHHADLVCFFSANVNVCGIANIAVQQGFTPRPDLGFSVVRVSCATAPVYAFAHEIGHNLGCMHDWNTEQCSNGGAPYAKAHVVDTVFQTMVGSTADPRIPYFSNPDVLVMTDPTGVPIAAPQPAHNAAAVTLSGPVVARFRSADCNGDGLCDDAQIAADLSLDCNLNGVLDACEPDWNRNGVPDECDIAAATSLDIDADGIPDEAEAARLYVNAAAPAGGIGLAWGGAYDELRDALALAEVSGDVSEIWVAAGTYKPAPATWAALAFRVPESVSLYGGFAGGETVLEQRDIGANTTVLSGDLLGDDGPDLANRDDNSVHVVEVRSGGTVVIDGFTITGGHAEQPPNCSLDWVGGGLLALFTEVTIRNCRFEENAAVNGGGLFTADGSVPVVIDCDFVGNRTVGPQVEALGAGAYFFNSPAQANAARVINCRFLGNISEGDAGGVFTRNWSPTFTNCEFVGNRTLGSFGRGAGLRTSFTVLPVFTNCVFVNNISDGFSFGGALFIFRSQAVVSNCISWGNSVNGVNNQNAQVSFVPVTGTTDAATVNNSIIQHWDGTLAGVTGAGNSALDPLFVDAHGPDDIRGTDDDDLRLSAGSPGIDAGDNTLVPADTFDLDADGDLAEAMPVDLAGGDRFIDDAATADTGVPGNGRVEVVDIGAHEFFAAAPACPCEFTGDSPAAVDVFDLLAYLDLWFVSGSAADIDGGAGVDVFDLLTFLDCWFPASAGTACP